MTAIIQLLAASYVKRTLIYTTFHDKTFTKCVSQVWERLEDRKTTVGDLYNYLVQFSRMKTNINLFHMIMQTGKDSTESESEVDRQNIHQRMTTVTRF